ncbi:uncharacterized protein MONBRDRAFT_31854 [Monosiga brevicollis MX1]|uniref:Indoleamine 2,3-dioxygenase n=1 Tax=Monosiga brevicollis TaxID=81824 RepID=A9UVU0_MONBE|nr:uncharacterized protein MONBRDRAFT_31854 [Monosiga brevicollis MX1]EDQ90646.1 predicted protein [Monosiga brevicollis MX1]|eukprot:XP_001744697.1 hypothetical protein [Monosiga brevicollis MX1]
MATNAYVWCAGAEQGLDTIPAPLSTLAHAAGRLLGIAPIATHYTVDMFNWNLRDPSLPPLADNIDILHSFTGTPDETWFYAVTTEIEYRGGVSLQHMLSAIEAAAKKDSAGVTAALHGVSASIEASQAALHRMHEHLDPDVFYNQIRIFLAGWRNNPNLPNGVVYAGVDHEQPQHYFGASAAQSPAIAALDVFLGVRHGTAGDASTAVEDPDKKTEVHYLQAMRHYMVERHRAFLSQLAIEREVLQHFLPESSQAARDAYAGVAAALKAFRDEHLRIVARFIINPARSTSCPPLFVSCLQPPVNATSLKSQKPNKHATKSRTKNKFVSCLFRAYPALVDSKVKGDGGPAERGTGGTELVQFLKDVRQDGYQRALSTLN